MPEAMLLILIKINSFKANFIREVEEDDILKLMEIKWTNLKFNSEKTDQSIAVLNEQLEQIKNHLSNIVNYTIDWFTNLKENTVRITLDALKFVVSIPLKWQRLSKQIKNCISTGRGFIGTALKKRRVRL